MIRRFSQAIVPVLLCLVLTQCASFPGGWGKGSRARELDRLGYEAVSLQKLRGDVRYSGVFRVNGLPMRFLVDSGANSTDVEATLARKARLLPDRKVSVVTRGALGREIKSGRGYGTLQIGPMFAPQFPFTVAPSSTRKTSTSSYAGQVGLDALSATGALVDIPGACLWVPGGNWRGLPSSLVLGLRAGLGRKVLQLETAGRLPHLILRGTMAGQAVTWVVDTGAEISVMAAESFDRLGWPSRTTNSRMIDASGDRIALRQARLENVTFGGVNVTVFDIAIAPLGTVREYFRDGSGRPVDGILGMDFLTNGDALVDSASGLIYMGKP